MDKYLQSIPTVKGIIQIGASSGQEVNTFKQYTQNIVLCEPLPYQVSHLKSRYPTCIVIPYAIGLNNVDDADFYVATNGGESSSLLKPLNHTKLYPTIKFPPDRHLKVPMRTFTSVIDEFNIITDHFNVLVTDTQGCDLQAIKSFGNNIEMFDLIIAEYIDSELYEHSDTSYDITQYLVNMGFDFIERYGGAYGLKNGSGNIVFKKITQL